MTESSNAGDRARGRASWPVRWARLSDEDGVEYGTPEERVGMMWQLALDAWAFAGLDLPTYTRAEAPVVMVRMQDR